MRAGMILLGLGLLILWVVALSVGATPWLGWFEFVAAILSLGAAFLPTAERGTATARLTALASASPFSLAVLLLVLWIIALVTRTEGWLTWWTFAFGLAYGLLGAGVGSTTLERRGPVRPPRTV